MAVLCDPEIHIEWRKVTNLTLTRLHYNTDYNFKRFITEFKKFRIELKFTSEIGGCEAPAACA